MVKDRSPSSSPVHTVRSNQGPLSPPPREQQFMSPGEGIETYGCILGADSPPQSAQSVKEEPSHFRYSVRKRKPAHIPPPQDQPPLVPIESLSSCSVSSGYNYNNPTNPFSPPAYDKPKPLVTSPDKKDHNPKSLVQSRIHMFTMPEENKATNKNNTKPNTEETIPSLAPPPIPTRPHRFVKSYTIDTDTVSPTSPTSPTYTKPFTSRDRLRPFSPTDKQRAISKLLHDVPVNEQSAFHPPAPKFTTYVKNTNPFLSSPDTPPETKMAAKSNRPSDPIKQTYMSSRCSSDESLTEFSSLLKDDEKSDSRSSVCIYFDGKDIPDTLV